MSTRSMTSSVANVAAMSVTEFGQRLGISRAAAYRIVAAGEVNLIDAKSSGKRPRARITEAEYERFLAKRSLKGRSA